MIQVHMYHHVCTCTVVHTCQTMPGVGVCVGVCGCVWVCVGVVFRHSNRGLITKGTIGSPVGKRPPFAKRVQNI